ncbi:YbhB/YbcL family Raf kinase inhibitor-like protein [Burkholderia plantarii]|uniref:YbhB/YbcL family Raf kinase inhibitor-like protein n=1 Tax=Burkholderia plantarii TaxID=41899 RepID=UPI0018DC3BC7|nr:YbhB/YbcL family Raf kinase inhibitor-like protein [Burkholderia plantarii]MBI0326638.1 YbhB/YbcL family Raf kinase inhibitor-like protein [Burkholderia plantarii]
MRESRQTKRTSRRRGVNAWRLLAVLAAAFASLARPGAQTPFSVTSPELRDGGRVSAAQRYGGGACHGENRSPALAWQNPPRGTRSYAITMFDLDAPGRGWWHWAVADIPASTTGLPANASGSGFLGRLGAVEARNDFGGDGYGGPCPPPGKPHRYVITVYALDTGRLRAAQGRPPQLFDHEISVSALAYARLTVIDER